jgi:hypothetical protein
MVHVSRRFTHKASDLPTFSADDGKVKSQRSRHGGATITLSQAIVLAAVSASVAAVLTAFGASHYLMEHFDMRSDSVVTMSHTTKSTFSRHMSSLDNNENDAPSTAEKLNSLSSFGKIPMSSMQDETASLFEGRIQEPEFLRRDNDAKETDDGQLKVVWLMSFPNRYVSLSPTNLKCRVAL